MHIKYVLTVATFTEGSENALERAAELAAQHRALLYVLHRPGGDASHPIDAQHRVALRAQQLAQRYGVALGPLLLSGKRLVRLIEEKAQDLLLVIDAATARQLALGPMTREDLWAGFPRGRRFLDLSACALLVVKRTRGQAHRLALLPYRAAADADRALACAQAFADDCAHQLFLVGPAPAQAAEGLLPSVTGHLKEWPPPASPAPRVPRIDHADYLSTRRNRAIAAFDTASTARRIGNQVRFSGADLVIAPYVAPSLVERVLRSSLRDRLIRDLSCDLAFLPDPTRQRTALTASERLRASTGFALRALAALKERRHA